MAKSVKSKEELRKELITRRKQVFSSDKNAIIEEKTFAFCNELLLEKGEKLNVCCYVSFFNEVDTRNLIKRLKGVANVFVPVSTATPLKMQAKKLLDYNADFSVDKLGNISDNLVGNALENFDVIITPLLGFNENLFRIGYGKGYYDRFFTVASGIKLGLAFFEQFQQFIPSENDAPLDLVITDKDDFKNTQIKHN